MKTAVVAFAALVACGTTDEMEPTYGDGLGTPEDPIPQDGVGYAVKTRIDLALTAASPSVAAAAAGMNAFAANPAHALLTLAQTAGVPELGQLYGALSATLQSRLEGWIIAEVDKVTIASKTARQVATDIAGFAETALTTFGIDSTLTFTPTHTTHTVKGVVFRLAGFEVVVPIGGLKADAIGQAPDLAVGSAGGITLGEHHFGLAFADHAWHGINLASSASFGAELRTSLGKLDCRTIADTVAAKCVSAGVCIGHATQLAAICERGLDLLVADLQSHVAAVDLTEVRYLAGTAKLVDENGDGLANRIENGVWDTAMSVDTTRATFSGVAEGR